MKKIIDNLAEFLAMEIRPHRSFTLENLSYFAGMYMDIGGNIKNTPGGLIRVNIYHPSSFYDDDENAYFGVIQDNCVYVSTVRYFGKNDDLIHELRGQGMEFYDILEFLEL